MGSTGTRSSSITESTLQKISEDWFYNKLTPQEQAQAWAFDTYNFTRDAGREKDIKVLESALGKYTLPGSIVTYRGVSAEEFATELFNYGSTGLKFGEMKGTSTNPDRATAFGESRGGYIIEYHIKAGNHGAYFDGGVSGSNEQQYVINRNVNYSVRSVEQRNKRIIIDVG